MGFCCVLTFCVSRQVHFLYQFSLKFFLEIFQCVLYENAKLNAVKDPQARLRVLVSDLFQVSCFGKCNVGKVTAHACEVRESNAGLISKMASRNPICLAKV